LESGVVPWRYVPGKRCNFQIELVIARGPGAAIERRRVVGKVYAKNHGAKVYRMLQEFRTYGFATDRFLVPQPLAYDARWNLLVLTWAEGELLRSLLLSDADVSWQIEDAADWLLQLHQCDVTTGPPLTLHRHLQTLMTQKQRLVEVYPESAGLLENLLLRIDERGAALAGWMPGPTHGDFSPDHLVFNSGQLTALDFDEFCQYDPMFDVAHFMSHLQLLGLRYFGAMNRFDALAERFRSAYQAGAPGYSTERLRLYQAVAYFKLAHIVAVVVRPPAWKEAVDTFLSEAQLALDLPTG
jgi:aminoglycoside phosphotransferase (APT) family kinase protein